MGEFGGNVDPPLGKVEVDNLLTPLHIYTFAHVKRLLHRNKEYKEFFYLLNRQ